MYVYKYIYVYLDKVWCIYGYVCVRLHVAAIQTLSCVPNSVTGDSNLYPLGT